MHLIASSFSPTVLGLYGLSGNDMRSIEPITSKNRLINYFRKNFQSQLFRRQIRVSMNSFIQANITVLNDGQFLHCRGSKWFDYRKGTKSAKKNKKLRFSYFVKNTHRPKISGKLIKNKILLFFELS